MHCMTEGYLGLNAWDDMHRLILLWNAMLDGASIVVSLQHRIQLPFPFAMLQFLLNDVTLL